jgi:hypothetical protein
VDCTGVSAEAVKFIPLNDQDTIAASFVKTLPLIMIFFPTSYFSEACIDKTGEATGNNVRVAYAEAVDPLLLVTTNEKLYTYGVVKFDPPLGSKRNLTPLLLVFSATM